MNYKFKNLSADVYDTQKKYRTYEKTCRKIRFKQTQKLSKSYKEWHTFVVLIKVKHGIKNHTRTKRGGNSTW